ncbi:MAG: peptidase [Acidimicrobiales bacterium]
MRQGQDHGGPDDDPFEGLVLDDSWADAATHHEASAQHRLAAVPDADGPGRKRTRRRRDRDGRGSIGARIRAAILNPTAARTVTAIALVVVGASYFNAGESGGSFILRGSSAGWPTPATAVSDTPLGVAPPAPERPGSFAFMRLQDDGVTPVVYDPCRPISIVVNESGAPPQARALLDDALVRMTETTGLQFEIERRTSEVPQPERPAYLPDLYGDRWAPVLVAWTDEETIPRLDGYMGLGGSTAVVADDGTWVYVSGTVYLHTQTFVEVLAEPHGWELARGTVLHEFGHVVGLDHVDDQRELMDHRNHRYVVDFQSGDLAGLSHLGQGACVPRL